MMGDNATVSYEVNIRQLLRALVRRWKTLAVSSAAVLVVTLVTYLLVPRPYVASVLLSAPGHRTIYGERITKSNYMGIVLNSELAVLVSEELEGELHEDLIEPEGLLDFVRVQSGQGDTFSIEVVMSHPEDAVLVANAWAEQYLSQASRLYGPVEELNQIAELRAEASGELEAVNRELASFRSSTGIGLIDGGQGVFPDKVAVLGDADRFGVYGSSWQAESALLSDYRIAIAHLQLVREAVELAASDSGIIEEDLPLELLRVPILEEDPELSPEALSDQDPQDLLDLLSEKEDALSAAAEQLQARIEEMQQQFGQQVVELERLLLAQWDARESYDQVRREEWKVRLWQETHSHSLSIVAPARSADRVMQVSLEARLIVAAVVGLMIGMLVVWWQEFGSAVNK